MLTAVDEAERGDLAIFIQQHGIGQLRDAEGTAQGFGKNDRQADQPMVGRHGAIGGFCAIPRDHHIDPVRLGARGGAQHRQQRLADRAVG